MLSSTDTCIRHNSGSCSSEVTTRDGKGKMTETSGKLERIWIKRSKRGPMDPAQKAVTVTEQGIIGNANQGGRRQVTVIEKEVFETIAHELGRPVDPMWRRANLLVSGISLALSRGRILRVGNLRLQIEGETKPCERMDEACPGLRRALEPDWRGGVYGIVLNDCEIQVGDPVSFESAPPGTP